MDSVPGSGLYYPNNLARISLLALEEVMGTNGMNALLRLANKNEYIGKLPPDTVESEFDFADFSMIFGALDEMYGANGSRMLGIRAGMATFDASLKNMGEAIDVNDKEFSALPVSEKIRVAISIVGITFTQSTRNLPAIHEYEDRFVYSVRQCPVCWGRITQEPSCHFFSGLLRGSIKWVTRGIDIEIKQISAHSCGAASCGFSIPKDPLLA
jgi:predicted hydrocarbon binding protein